MWQEKLYNNICEYRAKIVQLPVIHKFGGLDVNSICNVLQRLEEDDVQAFVDGARLASSLAAVGKAHEGFNTHNT